MHSHSSENTSTSPNLDDTAGRVDSSSSSSSSGGSVPGGTSLQKDLGVLTHEIGVLVQATWDRTRLRLRSAARSVFAGVVALIVVTFFLTHAALSVLDGLRGAFTRVSGSLWVGDLFAGLLSAGGVVFGLWMLVRRDDRLASNALRAKYDAPASAPLSPPSPNPPERSES